MLKIWLFCFLIAHISAIWPIPAHYTFGGGILWIDPGVVIDYRGVGQVSSSSHVQASLLQLLRGLATQYGGHGTRQADDSSSSQAIIAIAIERTYDTLFRKQFVPWKFHPRNSDFEPTNNVTRTSIRTIQLLQTATDPNNIRKAPTGTVDEAYTLVLTKSGDVTITAASSIGLAHGLTTFTQLFYKHTSGSVYTTLAPVEIIDAPVFEWRGLNMDVARSYYPPSDICRMIDALAFNKMNRLHLHMTDAQSWPLEIPSLPLLAGKGAYGPGLSYSTATIQQIQEYGSVRGVQVIIEIDMPGHTSAIAYSYPDLIAAFDVQPNWNDYSAEPPSGSMKLNSSAVTRFLCTLFDDILPRVKPYSSYFHTGGDEVNLNAYTLDDTVGTNESTVLIPLLQAFVDRNHAQVRAAGLTPVVWEEMLLQWNLKLGADVIVQTWQSDAAVAATVSKGHRALAGNYNYWYLDCGQGQWLDFQPGRSSQSFYPYADYCSPRKNWRLMYAYDPLEGVPANLSHLVLGGEAHIWSEQTDAVNLDRQVWPRTCAAAEVLWSGAKDASGRNRSQVEASPRLSEMRERLIARGVMAEPVRMPFCSQNGTQCAL